MAGEEGTQNQPVSVASGGTPFMEREQNDLEHLLKVLSYLNIIISGQSTDSYTEEEIKDAAKSCLDRYLVDWTDELIPPGARESGINFQGMPTEKARVCLLPDYKSADFANQIYHHVLMLSEQNQANARHINASPLNANRRFLIERSAILDAYVEKKYGEALDQHLRYVAPARMEKIEPQTAQPLPIKQRSKLNKENAAYFTAIVLIALAIASLAAGNYQDASWGKLSVAGSSNVGLVNLTASLALLILGAASALLGKYYLKQAPAPEKEPMASMENGAAEFEVQPPPSEAALKQNRAEAKKLQVDNKRKEIADEINSRVLEKAAELKKAKEEKKQREAEERKEEDPEAQEERFKARALEQEQARLREQEAESAKLIKGIAAIQRLISGKMSEANTAIKDYASKVEGVVTLCTKHNVSPKLNITVSDDGMFTFQGSDWGESLWTSDFHGVVDTFIKTFFETVNKSLASGIYLNETAVNAFCDQFAGKDSVWAEKLKARFKVRSKEEKAMLDALRSINLHGSFNHEKIIEVENSILEYYKEELKGGQLPVEKVEWALIEGQIKVTNIEFKQGVAVDSVIKDAFKQFTEAALEASCENDAEATARSTRVWGTPRGLTQAFLEDFCGIRGFNIAGFNDAKRNEIRNSRNTVKAQEEAEKALATKIKSMLPVRPGETYYGLGNRALDANTITTLQNDIQERILGAELQDANMAKNFGCGSATVALEKGHIKATIGEFPHPEHPRTTELKDAIKVFIETVIEYMLYTARLNSINNLALQAKGFRQAINMQETAFNELQQTYNLVYDEHELHEMANRKPLVLKDLMRFEALIQNRGYNISGLTASIQDNSNKIIVEGDIALGAEINDDNLPAKVTSLIEKLLNDCAKEVYIPTFAQNLNIKNFEQTKAKYDHYCEEEKLEQDIERYLSGWKGATLSADDKLKLGEKIAEKIVKKYSPHEDGLLAIINAKGMVELPSGLRVMEEPRRNGLAQHIIQFLKKFVSDHLLDDAVDTTVETLKITTYKALQDEARLVHAMHHDILKISQADAKPIPGVKTLSEISKMLEVYVENINIEYKFAASGQRREILKVDVTFKADKERHHAGLEKGIEGFVKAVYEASFPAYRPTASWKGKVQLFSDDYIGKFCDTLGINKWKDEPNDNASNRNGSDASSSAQKKTA